VIIKWFNKFEKILKNKIYAENKRGQASLGNSPSGKDKERFRLHFGRRIRRLPPLPKVAKTWTCSQLLPKAWI